MRDRAHDRISGDMRALIQGLRNFRRSAVQKWGQVIMSLPTERPRRGGLRPVGVHVTDSGLGPVCDVRFDLGRLFSGADSQALAKHTERRAKACELLFGPPTAHP